jgi:hypothetical protein
MTPDQIAEAIRLHGMWLRGEAAGQCADLRYADLRYADLRDAYLPNNCIAMHCGLWWVFATPTSTSIGCQDRPNAEWLAMSRDDAAALDGDAAAWFDQWGDLVRLAIEKVAEAEVVG